MKPPRSVRVLGYPWTLRGVRGLMADEGVYGDCDSDANTIRYAMEQSPHSTRDTVLHELTHAIDETLRLGLTEQQVSNLSTVLLATLRDNPKLSEFLLSK